MGRSEHSRRSRYRYLPEVCEPREEGTHESSSLRAGVRRGRRERAAEPLDASERMKVERFIVGWVRGAAGIWRRDDDMDREIRFPVPAYLIETDTERILVDTGLHPGAAADAEGHYGRALGPFALEQEASIADQLDVSAITKVVL